MTNNKMISNGDIFYTHTSGQMTIIPKPELSGFWGDSLTITTIWGDLGGFVAI